MKKPFLIFCYFTAFLLLAVSCHHHNDDAKPNQKLEVAENSKPTPKPYHLQLLLMPFQEKITLFSLKFDY